MEAVAAAPGGLTSKKNLTYAVAAVVVILLIVWYVTSRKKGDVPLTEDEKVARKNAWKKTAIVVGSATAIGFIGDVIMYSVGKSEGGKFKVSFPQGKDLAQVLIIGIITGFVIDVAMKAILQSQKVDAEKNLDKLVEAEVNRIKAGKVPEKAAAEKVVWKA